MRHFDAFVRWTAALLLTVLSIACGKDKTTTTEGSGNHRRLLEPDRNH